METGTDLATEAAGVRRTKRKLRQPRARHRFGKATRRLVMLPLLLVPLCALGACERPPAEEPAALDGEPVNVFSTVFFDQLCPRVHDIYEVPDGKLLIIEDASADAHDAATASIPGNPGIVEDTAIHLSIRTNPSGTDPMGSADHMIVAQRGLPAAGGRAMRGYAAPGSRVLFLIGGCTVPVNTNVQFSGRLIDYP